MGVDFVLAIMTKESKSHGHVVVPGCCAHDDIAFAARDPGSPCTSFYKLY